MPILELRNFSLDRAGVQICNQLQWSVSAGECWGVLGRNGSGKSTLLLALVGIHPPSTGGVYWREQSLQTMSRRQIACNLGVLLQENRDPFPTLVKDTVAMGRYPHLGNWRREREVDRTLVSQAIADMDLGSLEDRSITALSGGEQRRVAIATVLAQDPSLFILDEPTNHLDINYQIHILTLVNQKLQGTNKAAIMSLHDVNLAARFCSHLLFILGEGNTRLGKTNEILTEENLQQLYCHRMQRIQHKKQIWFMPS